MDIHSSVKTFFFSFKYHSNTLLPGKFTHVINQEIMSETTYDTRNGYAMKTCDSLKS